MPTVNYAEKWQRELTETVLDNTYIAPFVAADVNWLDAKTFHFTTMQVDGYKQHALTGGWQRGDFVQDDYPYTVTHDRDIEFYVDKRNVDESNQTASIQNISRQFMATKATPEMDAYFFSKVAAVAAENSLTGTTALSGWTKDNVVKKLLEIIGKVRRYRNKGLVLYLRLEIMDLLSQAPDFTRTIDVATLTQGDGKAIETRITQLNGVPLVEVVDTDRFYTGFDFTSGFKPAVGAYPINVLAATPLTTQFVQKIASIYFFEPGQHTLGDGYLYQNRAFWDAFVFPNGADGAVDSVYVDRDTAAVTA